MLALPYITECTGFKGVVYATELTLHIGRYVVLSAVHWSDVIHLLFIYLHQGGDVTDSVCPFVCLSVCVTELLPFKHYQDVPELK